jgi:hypothetical protein
MTLPRSDIAYLDERGIVHEIVPESGMLCVVMPQWPLPSGLDRGAADLLLRLCPGYPDVPPDMWWFSPAVHLANGTALPATSVMETYLGRQWQRWSRHFTNGQWQSGVDGLASYLALIRHDLARSVPAMVP